MKVAATYRVGLDDRLFHLWQRVAPEKGLCGARLGRRVGDGETVHEGLACKECLRLVKDDGVKDPRFQKGRRYKVTHELPKAEHQRRWKRGQKMVFTGTYARETEDGEGWVFITENPGPLSGHTQTVTKKGLIEVKEVG